MSEVQCILAKSLVSEKVQLKEDLFKGKALDILILLLNGEKTAADISRNLEIPIFSTMLYVSRLLKENLIVESKIIAENNMVEKIYKLCTANLDIINNHSHNSDKDGSKKLECEVMASHFSKLTTNSIKNIYKHQDKPYVIKSCFIKANGEKMEKFQDRLNALFDEFNMMEEEDGEETYGFIASFTPYKVE